jgi:hypothetical protein
VQRLLDGHPGVLEPGDVHDTAHGVLGDRPAEELGVEDGATDERHTVRDGLRMTAGQVVDHDRVDPRHEERSHDVRADVSGAAGDQP